MTVRAYVPNIQETKAGGLQIPGQSGLHIEILSKKKKHSPKTNKNYSGEKYMHAVQNWMGLHSDDTEGLAV